MFFKKFKTIYFSIMILSAKLIFSSNLFALDSIDQKIGQMIVIGFKGTTLDSEPRLAEYIALSKIGGVILFDYDLEKKAYDRNISSPRQLKKLIADIKSQAERPVFVMIDQEGGQVARLHPRLGFKRSLSAKEVAERQSPLEASQQYDILASELDSLGFNVNLAPTIDLAINPDNQVINGKERSYSENPLKVIQYAEQFIESLNQYRIANCIKHFPGHGSSEFDTHFDFVDITKTWIPKEMEPYSYFIKREVIDMVMIGHLFHADFDPVYPASLSELTIKGVLRGKLGFDGVVITDSLQMKAISDRYSLEVVLEKAINAGCDILLFANNGDYDMDLPNKIIHIVKEKIKQGLIDPERIEESYQRIMKLKKGLK